MAVNTWSQADDLGVWDSKTAEVQGFRVLQPLLDELADKQPTSQLEGSFAVLQKHATPQDELNERYFADQVKGNPLLACYQLLNAHALTPEQTEKVFRIFIIDAKSRDSLSKVYVHLLRLIAEKLIDAQAQEKSKDRRRISSQLIQDCVWLITMLTRVQCHSQSEAFFWKAADGGFFKQGSKETLTFYTTTIEGFLNRHLSEIDIIVASKDPGRVIRLKSTCKDVVRFPKQAKETAALHLKQGLGPEFRQTLLNFLDQLELEVPFYVNILMELIIDGPSSDHSILIDKMLTLLENDSKSSSYCSHDLLTIALMRMYQDHHPQALSLLSKLTLRKLIEPARIAPIWSEFISLTRKEHGLERAIEMWSEAKKMKAWASDAAVLQGCAALAPLLDRLAPKYSQDQFDVEFLHFDGLSTLPPKVSDKYFSDLAKQNPLLACYLVWKETDLTLGRLEKVFAILVAQAKECDSALLQIHAYLLMRIAEKLFAKAEQIKSKDPSKVALFNNSLEQEFGWLLLVLMDIGIDDRTESLLRKFAESKIMTKETPTLLLIYNGLMKRLLKFNPSEALKLLQLTPTHCRYVILSQSEEIQSLWVRCAQQFSASPELDFVLAALSGVSLSEQSRAAIFHFVKNALAKCWKGQSRAERHKSLEENFVSLLPISKYRAYKSRLLKQDLQEEQWFDSLPSLRKYFETHYEDPKSKSLYQDFLKRLNSTPFAIPLGKTGKGITADLKGLLSVGDKCDASLNRHVMALVETIEAIQREGDRPGSDFFPILLQSLRQYDTCGADNVLAARIYEIYVKYFASQNFSVPSWSFEQGISLFNFFALHNVPLKGFQLLEKCFPILPSTISEGFAERILSCASSLLKTNLISENLNLLLYLHTLPEAIIKRFSVVFSSNMQMLLKQSLKLSVESNLAETIKPGKDENNLLKGIAKAFIANQRTIAESPNHDLGNLIPTLIQALLPTVSGAQEDSKTVLLCIKLLKDVAANDIKLIDGFIERFVGSRYLPAQLELLNIFRGLWQVNTPETKPQIFNSWNKLIDAMNSTSLPLLLELIGNLDLMHQFLKDTESDEVQQSFFKILDRIINSTFSIADGVKARQRLRVLKELLKTEFKLSEIHSLVGAIDAFIVRVFVKLYCIYSKSECARFADDFLNTTLQQIEKCLREAAEKDNNQNLPVAALMQLYAPQRLKKTLEATLFEFIRIFPDIIIFNTRVTWCSPEDLLSYMSDDDIIKSTHFLVGTSTLSFISLAYLFLKFILDPPYPRRTPLSKIQQHEVINLFRRLLGAELSQKKSEDLRSAFEQFKKSIDWNSIPFESRLLIQEISDQEECAKKAWELICRINETFLRPEVSQDMMVKYFDYICDHLRDTQVQTKFSAKYSSEPPRYSTLQLVHRGFVLCIGILNHNKNIEEFILNIMKVLYAYYNIELTGAHRIEIHQFFTTQFLPLYLKFTRFFKDLLVKRSEGLHVLPSEMNCNFKETVEILTWNELWKPFLKCSSVQLFNLLQCMIEPLSRDLKKADSLGLFELFLVHGHMHQFLTDPDFNRLHRTHQAIRSLIFSGISRDPAVSHIYNNLLLSHTPALIAFNPKFYISSMLYSFGDFEPILNTIHQFQLDSEIVTEAWKEFIEEVALTKDAEIYAGALQVVNKARQYLTSEAEIKPGTFAIPIPVYLESLTVVFAPIDVVRLYPAFKASDFFTKAEIEKCLIPPELDIIALTSNTLLMPPKMPSSQLLHFSQFFNYYLSILVAHKEEIQRKFQSFPKPLSPEDADSVSNELSCFLKLMSSFQEFMNRSFTINKDIQRLGTKKHCVPQIALDIQECQQKLITIPNLYRQFYNFLMSCMPLFIESCREELQRQNKQNFSLSLSNSAMMSFFRRVDAASPGEVAELKHTEAAVLWVMMLNESGYGNLADNSFKMLQIDSFFKDLEFTSKGIEAFLSTSKKHPEPDFEKKFNLMFDDSYQRLHEISQANPQSPQDVPAVKKELIEYNVQLYMMLQFILTNYLLSQTVSSEGNQSQSPSFLRQAPPEFKYFPYFKKFYDLITDSLLVQFTGFKLFSSEELLHRLLLPFLSLIATPVSLVNQGSERDLIRLTAMTSAEKWITLQCIHGGYEAAFFALKTLDTSGLFVFHPDKLNSLKAFIIAMANSPKQS